MSLPRTAQPLQAEASAQAGTWNKQLSAAVEAGPDSPGRWRGERSFSLDELLSPSHNCTHTATLLAWMYFRKGCFFFPPAGVATLLDRLSGPLSTLDLAHKTTLCKDTGGEEVNTGILFRPDTQRFSASQEAGQT